MKDATFKIHGRLGADVEFRETNGKRMAIISVATEERYLKDGVEVRKPHWHRLVCFKPNLMNYLGHFRKGALADFEGVIKQSEWEDANGTKQYATNLDVDDARLIGFLEKRDNQNQNNQGYDQNQDHGYDNQGYNQQQGNGQPQGNGQQQGRSNNQPQQNRPNNQAAAPPQNRPNNQAAAQPQGRNQQQNSNRTNNQQGNDNNAYTQAGNGYGGNRG